MLSVITALDPGAVPGISTIKKFIMGMKQNRQALKRFVLLRKTPLKRIENLNANENFANDNGFDSRLAVANA